MKKGSFLESFYAFFTVCPFKFYVDPIFRKAKIYNKPTLPRAACSIAVYIWVRMDFWLGAIQSEEEAKLTNVFF